MVVYLRARRVLSRILSQQAPILIAGVLAGASAFAQTAPPIPNGDIRIHYFRPDGNYSGWTIYAYGDTTAPNNFGAGPVAVTGTDSFGAYFDVGVTTGAANVGIIIHNGNTKDPGADEAVDPATQGNEFWDVEGSHTLQTSRPSTIQDPPIPAGHARIHYYRPDGNYANWSLYPYGATSDPTGNFCTTEDYVTGYDSYGAYYDVAVTSGNLGFILHNCSTSVKDPSTDLSIAVPQQLEGWVLAGNATVFPQPPTKPTPSTSIRVHYFRPDGKYTGWTIYAYNDTTEPNDFASGPVGVTGTDSFGAYFDVGIKAGATNVGLIIHNGPNKDPGGTEFVDPATQGNEYWELSGSDVLKTKKPPTGQDPPIPAGYARIHYYRPDGNYANWSLYPYGATTDPTGGYCTTEDQFTGYDSYGVYFDVAVTNGNLGFIIHNCTTGVKDSSADGSLPIPKELEGWVVSGNPSIFPQLPTAAQLLSGTFRQLQAYWIDATTVAIQPQFNNSRWTYSLDTSPTAGIQLTAAGITGATTIPLTPFGGSLTATELTRFPQLASYALFKLPASIDPTVVRQALKGQLEVSAVAADGTLKYATGVQSFGAIDALLAYTGQLGVIFNHGAAPSLVHRQEDALSDASSPVQIKVWAPTAQNVSLLLFDSPTDTAPEKTIAMQENNGVWVAAGAENWKGKYYQLRAQVYVAADAAIDTNTTTDPYSIDLSVNGTMSRITDLESGENKPPRWDALSSPALESINDMSIYELHVRDFSVGDPTVPAAHQGTYEAFTDFSSNGMQHLHTLSLAGLKAVHLLPTNHFGSVNEDKTTWATTGDLSQYPPDGQQQQAAVESIQGKDAYNWGYDPVHYMAPEGAYATNPTNRVKEYRDMVGGLHQAGLRVIQDVVFNHTYTAGQDPTANLDELVPNYYHRQDANGAIETGSCCFDTASEHQMMEKLMIDTVLLNAREYKIDGFRFDAMGLHFVYNMVDMRNALNALTLEKDGIDGSKIYMYGEGFQIAEASNNAIGPNASQTNLYGTGIGSFNDRMRDAVRGGYAFGGSLQIQGFGTGLATDSSSYTNQNTTTPDQLTTLLNEADLIRSSLAGSLKDFSFVDAQGQTVTAGQLTASGEPAGFTASPIEDVNYCSVHDNQTLFDTIQMKAAASDTVTARARRQVVDMSLLTLAEGVPFYHAADDLLRSKDMDNGSYNSGDWFNKIDWSMQGDNWGTGLPVGNVNQASWPVMQPLLANPALKPTPANIAATTQAFQEFLQIRYSTGLFRMATLDEVQSNLSFLNTGQSQIPGLIVMKLDDHGHNYGGAHHLVVFFNASNAAVTFTDATLAGMQLQLHPVQQNSSDATVKQAVFNSKGGTATIPALTTAVFVSDQE